VRPFSPSRVKKSFNRANLLQKISTVLLVVAVALLDENGRVLMQRRRLGGVHGGLWEFPGGKLEPDESPESAIRREIEEELGILLDQAALEPLAFASGSATPPESHPGLVILLYICRRWQGEPHCREGEEIRWFAPEVVADLDMPPLDYPLARALVSAPAQNSL
jgi:8-oxo-dGTP diphosphatase